MFDYESTFSSFSVDDIEAARGFYEDTLGLDVEQTPEGLALHLAAGAQVFIYEKDNHEPANFTVLNFNVVNIDEAVDQLSTQGVEFIRYDYLPAEQDDKEVLRGLAAGQGPDIAWFEDPAGNVLAITQSE